MKFKNLSANDISVIIIGIAVLITLVYDIFF